MASLASVRRRLRKLESAQKRKDVYVEARSAKTLTSEERNGRIYELLTQMFEGYQVPPAFEDRVEAVQRLLRTSKNTSYDATTIVQEYMAEERMRLLNSSEQSRADQTEPALSQFCGVSHDPASASPSEWVE